MIEYNVGSYRKNPEYEVRAIVTDSRLKPNNKESQENLGRMRRKLEKIIPASLKPKYNLTHEELIISVKVRDASRSQAMISKMHEFLRDAKRAAEAAPR